MSCPPYQVEGCEDWFDRLPSHYAGDIIREPSREKRREMLSKVPEPLREMTKHHVIDHFERMKHGH